MARITPPALALVLAVAALSLAALPLAAQTAEAPAGGEAAATQAAATEAAPLAGLSMGTEVATGNAVGDTYTAATFEAWEQRCVRTQAGFDPCQLYMLLKDADGNSVGEFSMFSLPESAQSPAAAGATFVAPLETLLTAGMTLQIDSGPARAYPFTFCAQIGCIARLGFTAEEVEQMKRGAEATIVIVPFVAPDARVELAMSLKGFTAGLAAVDAANSAADAAAAEAAAAEAAGE